LTGRFGREGKDNIIPKGENSWILLLLFCPLIFSPESSIVSLVIPRYVFTGFDVVIYKAKNHRIYLCGIFGVNTLLLRSSELDNQSPSWEPPLPLEDGGQY
jgi:hypothetical protein